MEPKDEGRRTDGQERLPTTSSKHPNSVVNTYLKLLDCTHSDHQRRIVSNVRGHAFSYMTKLVWILTESEDQPFNLEAR